MFTSLGRMVLLVHDYDQALEFYCDKLGFIVLHDSTASSGQRYLHIGVPGQSGDPPTGLWLLQPASLAEKTLVGRQTGREPLLVLYTANCRAAIARLQVSGVEVRQPPRAEGDAVFSHIVDLYGNEIVIVQLLSNGN